MEKRKVQNLKSRNELEDRVSTYIQSISGTVNFSALAHDGLLYPANGVKIGQKLLEELEASNLPEKRKQAVKKIISAATDWYIASDYLLWNRME